MSRRPEMVDGPGDELSDKLLPLIEPVAPDGRSVCATRAVQEDEPGDYHYALTIFRGEHRHGMPLEGGALVSASWAPDSSAVVTDVFQHREHHLLLIDTTSGVQRELARSYGPFEPTWLADTG